MDKVNQFVENGLHFECKQCSHCCRHEPGFVYLSENDLTKLCDWFTLDRARFIENYCRWVPYYDGNEVLCLQELANCDCIFWKNGCTAYGARPSQCRTYPFWDFIIRDAISWQKEASECPGINDGELHTWTEISQKVAEYRAHKPIKRK